MNGFNTIINPKKPLENKASNAFELYSLRKAGSMYFWCSLSKKSS